MRKMLLTLAFAASALTAATTVSLADDCDYGYSNGYSSYSNSYRVTQTYSRTTYYDCRTVSYRVWDDYSQTYIYRTREVCN
ncbi:hypothetical protein GCM10007874_67560 [Labrys miyagiensis]|uniref:Uncharacterized protein n=1 Tax=Labrys miyagiensis TaxID=346912 RepID=A0ABQ6CUD4_9HYPH|nr:hypothetical protein [Labrys miyagiensis]GLS23735.1 hypothetical protein GCM10007874_67560 [Labrys miyagiensis]